MQENMTPLPASVRALANIAEDIRQSMKNYENQIEIQVAGIKRFEAAVQSLTNAQEKISEEIYSLRRESEWIKAFCEKLALPADQGTPANLDSATDRNTPADQTAAATESQSAHENTAVPPFGAAVGYTAPFMPGTGFTNITAEYLKNLGKK